MSNCGCIYVSDSDYDFPDIFESKEAIAHKKHRCCECGKTIGVGEMHQAESGEWDGEYAMYRTCSVCTNIREVFFCNGYIYCQLHEHLSEHIREVYGDISEDCLTQLEPEARGIVCDLISEYWDEDEWDEDEEAR